MNSIEGEDIYKFNNYRAVLTILSTNSMDDANNFLLLLLSTCFLSLKTESTVASKSSLLTSLMPIIRRLDFRRCCSFVSSFSVSCFAFTIRILFHTSWSLLLLTRALRMHVLQACRVLMVVKHLNETFFY